MTNYRKINNITGWIVFAIATIVYMLTIEPTASWWDCGEYIATAYKLQVGHPPGAPLFQILGRFFTLFAFGDVSKVALMINIMSGLCSSFTILFLFWTISMLAKKIALQTGEMTEGKMITVLGSAVVGSLAYTFSDSFWFSATESEVYAMSSLFTAIVFWAILKWEENADKKTSNRWLLLIAYLMGLSIGVHLLNLLAIPAIVFVFYYRKYNASRKGFILTGIVSLLTLASMMYIIIPGIVDLSSSFEIFFVNSIGLPFNSGTAIYFLFIVGLIAWGLKYTAAKRKHVLNTVILAFVFILIGYSSFFMLIIRSNAKTPIDENSPKDAISLLSYLNREQYGSWPIFHGAYYNAPSTGYEEGKSVYIKDFTKGKYVVAEVKSDYIYDSRFTTAFPRIWSNREASHINKYKEYIKGESIMVDGKAIVKPTFRDNLRYFFSYQLGHMYVRYFLWNFVGRQNDIESQGTPKEGNWISGIDFIDNSRLGDQDLLPDAYKNHATNKFYFLPLILGFIGIFFHLKRSNKDSWVVFLLFLMTGLAIVIFLNQYPHQPRERDYAYAGSFYAFAIWIGLGVISLVEMTTRLLKNRKLNAIIISGVCLLLVPGLMATEGWDDHDRSGKYAAADFAKNYLNHCDENGILYTFGDNDTFPLWYAQEVEGIRTDVRVVNYMLSSGYWYVHQLARKAYDAEPLPFTLNFDQYNKSSNDILPYLDLKVEGHQELIEVIKFIASENEGTKRTFGQRKYNIFPTKKLKIKVDSAACVDNGIVPRELAHLIVDEIEWEIKSNTLHKNGLAFLDFLANNKWERSIYFSNPNIVEDVFNVVEYTYLDGVVYKFMPVKASSIDAELGGVLVESTFDKLVNKSKWGNLNDPKVTVDRESMRHASLMVLSKFSSLTRELVKQSKFDMAVQVADKYFEAFPPEKFSISGSSILLIEAYYKHGSFEKANKYSRLLFNRYAQEFDFCLNYPNGIVVFERDIRHAMGIMQLVSQYAKVSGQKEFATEMEERYKQKLNSI